tara:strand:- start:354 stop:821 length:468 start_codon:yes stop_codon:yes gene_type:complete
MLLPYSFLQIAGALPFSSFLKNKSGGKKTKRRTIKKKNLSRKKATRRKNLSHRRPIRKRTTKKSIKKMKSSKRTSKKLKKTSKKLKTNYSSRKKRTCNCDDSRYYKGNEPSPKGLGYCAHCTPLNVTMKGLDGNLWENQEYKKGRRWVKIRIDMN